MNSENPILNSPYDEPKLHYATGPDGSLNYNDIRENRRIFTPDIQAMPSKQGPQGSIFEVNDFTEYGTHIINRCRKEVGKWRDEKYPNTTRVTKELLLFWFENPYRHTINNLLGFAIPYVKDGKDKNYFTDFIVRC